MFKLSKSLDKFVSDNQGNMAVITAVGLSAILLCTGAAIDLTNIVNIRSKLSSAVDNSVLTAALSGETKKKKLKSLALSSFEQNYTYLPDQSLKDFKLIKKSGDRIAVEATISHKPIFSKLMGLDEIDLKVEAESLLSTNNDLDIALVLDRTGSMWGTKLSNLKTAAVDFLDDIESNNLRVSVVPFSDYVNIGLEYKNESWLDLNLGGSGDSDVVCSMVDNSNSSCFNPFSPPPSSSCSPGTSTSVTDDGTTRTTTTVTVTDNGNGTCTTTTRVEEVSGGSRSVSTSSQTTSGNGGSVSSNWANVSIAANGNLCTFGTDPADVSSSVVEECSTRNISGNWYGCVGSRNAPYNLQVGYNNRKLPPALELTCGQPLSTLSSDIDQAKNSIKSLTASGSTYLPAGLMWGWRTLDKNSMLNVTGNDKQKLLILMTDGQNTVSQSGLFHSGTDYRKANSFTEDLCDAIKSSGVKIATVSFSDGKRDKTTTKLLKDCASDANLYFEAKNAKTLKEAFESAFKSTQSIRLVN